MARRRASTCGNALMLLTGKHDFVELDLNNNEGVFVTIPKEIGPRVETRLAGVVDSLRPSGSMTFRSNAQFAGITMTASPNTQAAFASDRLQRFDAPVGALAITPPNVDKFIRSSAPKHDLAIAFCNEAYTTLAASELDGADWELQPPRFGHVDVRALRLARAMSGEISQAWPNMLFLDSLITIFGVHLIRYYSKAKLKDTACRSLSPHTSAKVREYMHEHLDGTVSIVAIATISRMSPSHFIRAFTAAFGMPPHQYLINLRLQKAERLLLESRIPVSEIALQSGFSSQSHLTDAMMRYR